MNDLISRQAAIDALTIEYKAVGILGEQWAISQCIDAIKKLPTIDLVKHGKWNSRHNGFIGIVFECSECGQLRSATADWNYCPNCGARMERSE